MKEEVAKLWIERLRDPKAKQGKDYLEKDGQQCCLGVLCRIAIAQGVPVCARASESGVVRFDGAEYILPVTVGEWAGLKTCSGYVHALGAACTQINDIQEKTFPEIADIIEQHWKGMRCKPDKKSWIWQ